MVAFVFKNNKNRQRVELTPEELNFCPFVRLTYENAQTACPTDHELQPIVIHLPGTTSAIGNVLQFLKKLPLTIRTKKDLVDLATLSVALEMENLAHLVLETIEERSWSNNCDFLQEVEHGISGLAIGGSPIVLDPEVTRVRHQ